MTENEKLSVKDLHLSKIIGEGAYAVVYKGVCKNQICAIKKIQLKSDNEEMIRREIANLYILGKYKHENIIEFINVVRDNCDLYLILEYMDGGSLHTYLHIDKYHLNFTSEDQRFKELIKLLVQTAKGLAFMHEKNIAHRDVKPGNLLLDVSKKIVKVGDLGFSKHLMRENTNNVGTSAYKAPEVLTGTNYTKQCDVFSLAITMWETLTQKIPYDGCTAAFLIIDVRKGKRPKLNEINFNCNELKTLIHNCWRHDDSRPTMEQVQRSLRHILAKGLDLPH